MPETPRTDPALALVHEGWDHMKRQRPLAAWASWQRALRIEPGHGAATHALNVLAGAGDLPEAARVDRKFLTPRGDAARGRWDARFRGQSLEELAVAASAFGGLADDDPADGRARFNQGLCLAWLGRNADAVAALDRAVHALAAEEPETAVDAWTLAEVLRHGAGAEGRADDLNHFLVATWTPGDPDPADFLDGRPDVVTMPSPIDPETGGARPGAFHEWLDRPPIEGPPPAEPTLADVRRVRCHALRAPGSLRLSGHDPLELESAFAEVVGRGGDRVASVRRESRPLPIPLLDHAIWWAVRPPRDIEREAAGRINREVVERFYEGSWLLKARIGLDGRSPIDAGRAASDGDPVARAKLAAVVRLREQLGARPSSAHFYQGYPFDRLRRRLGLPLIDPDAIDPADPASMSGTELDRLDPASLADFALLDAYESAAALGDDARTARFAAILAARDPSALARLDRPALFATLVRHALDVDDADLALAHLDRARVVDAALDGGRDRRKYETWRAEVNARAGRPDAAAVVYRNLLDESSDPALALDAAETLVDNGHDDHARALARLALDLAHDAGDLEAAARAAALL